jgi:hypothetical protein
VEAPVEALLVGDVHPAVLRPHRVEAVRLEAEVEGVADVMAHLLLQVQAVGQHPGGVHEGLREVHHGDVAAELGGQRAGRAAQPPAHVQHAQPGPGVEEVGEPQCCRLAAAVEVVGDGEVLDGEPVEILAGRGERGQDRLGETLPAPVVVHGVV